MHIQISHSTIRIKMNISKIQNYLLRVYKFEHYFIFSLGELGISLSLLNATSAALFPESNIEPNLAPIRGKPHVSVTAIPAAIKPGKISSVLLTTASSPPSTHIGSIPIHL